MTRTDFDTTTSIQRSADLDMIHSTLLRGERVGGGENKGAWLLERLGTLEHMQLTLGLGGERRERPTGQRYFYVLSLSVFELRC